ncbi:hypothetical protein C0993_000873 [Termitomyces sp. T159_Od127]|nr:hypothetical protein C0993_000873 [Termitomyces sp. T159_Od127]
MERDVFPRYHIGESMIPSCRHFMSFIGAEELIKEHGFVIKLQISGRRFWSGRNHVNKVPQKSAVDKISDEHGLLGILARRWAICARNKSRECAFIRSIHRQVDTNFISGIHINQSYVDETGWAWYIPLHDGTTSVGVVLAKQSYAEKKALASNGVDDPIRKLYMNQLTQAPKLMQFLTQAELMSEIKSAGDFSYSASHYAGPGYRIAGDAGEAFIDPLFSSGVHLAFTGGLSAASTISASIRGDCTEAKAVEYHNTKFGVSYTRFLIAVLGVYKQIRAQKEDILTEMDEDNFDRAFRLLRPILQGAADIDPRLTHRELEGAVNFCKNIPAPTQSPMSKEVAERIPDIKKPDGPIPCHPPVSAIVGDDENAKRVLLDITATRMLHVMQGLAHFRSEIFHGYYVNFVRGELGMREAL